MIVRQDNDLGETSKGYTVDSQSPTGNLWGTTLRLFGQVRNIFKSLSGVQSLYI